MQRDSLPALLVPQICYMRPTIHTLPGSSPVPFIEQIPSSRAREGMRIVTARSPSASPSRSSSPRSSKKHHPRPLPSKRWRKIDCVVSFPSSKRVQGAPRGNRSAAGPSSSRAGAEPSVWRRVSGAQPVACEDLVVCATATKKCDLDDPSQESRSHGDSKVAQMDIDPKAQAAPPDNKAPAVLDVSHKFTIKAAPAKERPQETNPHKISQRQKQIDYGKNTLGYERYLELVPRNQRKKCHPQTPNIKQVCSKRSWDGQVKKWRRLLHEYDPPVNDDDENPELFPLGGGADNGSAEDQENTGMAVDSESTPRGNTEVGTIYDDWDAMEP